MDKINISLSEKGKRMSYDDFVKTFGKAYVMHPSIDLKNEYKRLTGKDADSGISEETSEVRPGKRARKSGKAD